MGRALKPASFAFLLLFGLAGAYAADHDVTAISLPTSGTYGIGNTVGVTITTSGATTGTLSFVSGSCIGPWNLTGSLTYSSGYDWTASFTVTDGSAEYASGDTISTISIQLYDGSSNSSIYSSPTYALTGSIILDGIAPNASGSTPSAFAVTGGTVVSGYLNNSNTGFDVTVSTPNDSTLVGGTIKFQAYNGAAWIDIGSQTLASGDINQTDKVFSFTGTTVFTNGTTYSKFQTILTDLAGNSSTSGEYTYSLIVDKTAPTASTPTAFTATGNTVVSGYLNNSNTGFDVTVPISNDSTLDGGSVKIEASSNNGVNWSDIGSATSLVSGDINTSKTISFTDSLTDGLTYTFRAILTDRAGNESTPSSATVSGLVVDKTPPTLTPVSIASSYTPSTKAAIGHTLTLIWTASENIQNTTAAAFQGGSPVTASGSGLSWSATSAALTGSEAGLTSGSAITFEITFSDLAGNPGTPVTSITSGDNVTYFRILTWNGTGTDWNTNANWTPNFVPTQYDDVTINTTSNNPILSGNSAAGNITVGSGATLFTGSHDLSITDSFTLAGTLSRHGGSADVQKLPPTGKVIYTNGGAIQDYDTGGGADYNELELTGAYTYNIAGSSNLTASKIIIAGGAVTLTGTSSTLTCPALEMSTAYDVTFTVSGALTFTTVPSNFANLTITADSVSLPAVTATSLKITVPTATTTTVSLGNLSVSGNIEIAGHTLTTGTISAADLKLTTNSAFVFKATTVTGALEVGTGGGNITQSGNVSVVGTAKLTAGVGNITLGSTGTPTLALSSLEVVSGGAVSVNETDGFSVAGINATGAVSVTSGGNVSTSGAVSGTSLAFNLNGTPSDLTVNGDLTATGGGITIEAKDATIQSGHLVLATGNFQVAASGNVSIASPVGTTAARVATAVIDATGTASLTAAVYAVGAVTVGGTTPPSGITISGGLTTTSGDVSLNGGTVTIETNAVNAAGAVSITASGNVEIKASAATLSSGGAITIDASGAVALAAAVTAAGNIKVGETTQPSGISISGGLTTTSSGDVLLKASSGNVSITTTAVSAAGKVDIDTSGAVTLSAAVTAAGNIKVGETTQPSGISISGGLTTTSSGDVLLKASSGNVSITTTAVSAAGKVDIDTSGTVTLSAAVTAAGNVTVGGTTPPSGITISGGLTTTSGDVVLTAGATGVSISAAVDSGGAVEIDTTGPVTLTAAIEATGQVAVDGGSSDITVSGGITTGVGGLISIEGDTVTIETNAVNAGGAVSITASGNVEIKASATTLGSGSTITIDAAGTVTLAAAVNAAGNIDIDTSGAVDLAAAVTAAGNVTVGGTTPPSGITISGALTATGGDISLTAGATGVSISAAVDSGGAVEIDTTGPVTLSAAVTAAADVTVGGTTPPTITISGGITTGAGGLISLEGGTVTINTAALDAAGAINITATTNVQVDSALMSGGAITIDAAGTVTLSAAVTAAADVTVGGTTPPTSITISGGLTTTTGDVVLTGGTVTIETNAVNAAGAVSITASGDVGISAEVKGSSIAFHLNTSSSELTVSGSLTVTDSTMGVLVNAKDINISAGTITTGDPGLSLNGSAITIGGAVTLGKTMPATASPVAIINTGLLTLASGIPLTLYGDFTQSGGGAVNLGRSLTNPGHKIDFVNAVSLTEDVTLSTDASGAAAGIISFGASLGSLTSTAKSLTLDAGQTASTKGNVTISGTVGTTYPLNNLTVYGQDLAFNGGIHDGSSGPGVTGNLTLGSETSPAAPANTIALTGGDYRVGGGFSAAAGGAITLAGTGQYVIGGNFSAKTTGGNLTLIGGTAFSAGGTFTAQGNRVLIQGLAAYSATGAMNITAGTAAGEGVVVNPSGSGALSFAAPSISFSDLYLDYPNTITLTLNSNVSITGRFVFYKGTLNLPGRTLIAAGDLVIFGSAYSSQDAGRTGTHLGNTLFAYPAQGNLLYYPGGGADSSSIVAGSLGAAFSASGLDGATLATTGGNFYLNGANMQGVASWTLNFRNSAGTAALDTNPWNATGWPFGTVYAAAFNATIVYGQGVSNAAGGAVAASALANNVTNGGNNTGWNFSNFTILHAETVFDNMVRVTLSEAAENANGEISTAATNGVFRYHDDTDSGTSVYKFTQSYVLNNNGTADPDDDYFESTNGKGNLSVFYLYVPRGTFNNTDYRAWNTDATGTSPGAAASTDRNGNHSSLVPQLFLIKGSLFAAAGHNLLVNYGYNTDGVNTPAPPFTGTTDECRPTLTAAAAGRAPHDSASPTEYDAHNFLHLRYSEAVKIGNLDIPNINVSTDNNARAEANFTSASEHGGHMEQGTGGDSGNVMVSGLIKYPGIFRAGSLDGLPGNSLYRSAPANPAGAHGLTIFLAGWRSGAAATDIWPGYLGDPALLTTLTVENLKAIFGPTAGGADNWITNVTGTNFQTLFPDVTILKNENITDGANNKLEHSGVARRNVDGVVPPKILTVAAYNAAYGSTPFATTTPNFNNPWDVEPPFFSDYSIDNVPSPTPYYEILIRDADNNDRIDTLDFHIQDNYFSNRGEWDVSGGTWDSNSNQPQTDPLWGIRDSTVALHLANAGLPPFTIGSNSSERINIPGPVFSTEAKQVLFQPTAPNQVNVGDDSYFSVSFNQTVHNWPVLTSLFVDYTAQNGRFTDLAGNLMPSSAARMEVVEKIAPRIQLTLLGAGSNRLYVHFTEPVRVIDTAAAATTPPRALLPADFSLDGSYVGSHAITGIDFGLGVGVSPPEPYFATGFFLILNAPATPDFVFSTQLRTSSSSIKIADNLGNVIDPPEVHRITDVGLNLVEPVFADDGINTDTAAGGISPALRVFDGSGRLLPRDMVIETKILVPHFLGSSLNLFFDVDVPAGMKFFGPGIMETPFWMPQSLFGLAIAPNTQARVVSPFRTDATSGIRDFLVPGTDQEIRSGKMLEFIYTLDGLVCARWPQPQEDPRKIAPWMINLQDVILQAGGVTILNNVINPLVNEECTLLVELARPGMVTINVFSLSGDLVDIIHRGSSPAGEYTFRWDGRNRSGEVTARGVYLIRVVGPGIDEYRKVLVVKP